MSDVSTRNNIAGNYASPPNPTDLWNRLGGSTFSFIDCVVSGVDGPAGEDHDAAIGWRVGDAEDRPSAKMIDLDPAWQFSSEIWGLEVRIVDPSSGALALRGQYRVASFRDLFARQLSAPNGQPRGGRYVSVVENVEWGPAAENSAVLRSLRDTTEGGRLSVCMHVFGYWYRADNGHYTTGSVIGSIGPWRSGEPLSVVVARRIQSFVVQGAVIMGPLDFELDDERLSMDFGHALQIADDHGTPLSPRQRFNDVTSDPALGFIESDGRFTLAASLTVGDLGWYRRTGGVVSIELASDVAARARQTPMALGVETSNGWVPVARETHDGVFARADDFVFRLDAGATAEAHVHVRRFGKPIANRPVYFDAASSNALQSAALDVRTDASGVARVELASRDPGNPRGVIDGQIVTISYGVRGSPGAVDPGDSGLDALDVLVAHVRDAYTIPDAPEFHADIRPLMQQYAYLYPVMSVHLFNLADYDALVRHRRLLIHVFSRNIQDPNYMPTTRDLSEPKRQMLLRWLQSETGDAQRALKIASAPDNLAGVVEDHIAALNAFYAETASDLKRGSVLTPSSATSTPIDADMLGGLS